jgi:Na+/phosphate symporter
MRMVQSGVERAFGSALRRVLGRALRNRLLAVTAGTGVTMLLQSSTATAMMVTSFAARGAIELIPALAVMLGANVGTALIVKALLPFTPLLAFWQYRIAKECLEILLLSNNFPKFFTGDIRLHASGVHGCKSSHAL